MNLEEVLNFRRSVRVFDKTGDGKTLSGISNFGSQ